jgi:hypothetical protein
VVGRLREVRSVGRALGRGGLSGRGHEERSVAGPKG